MSQLPAATLHVEPCRSLRDPRVRKCRPCLSFMRAVPAPLQGSPQLTFSCPACPFSYRGVKGAGATRRQGQSVRVCSVAQTECPTLVTPLTVAHQAPLPMEVCSQEYWSGLPCPPPGDLPYPGIEPPSPEYPALAGGSLLMCHMGSLPAIAVRF